MKIGLISSRGGHLFQTFQLKSWWECYNRFWITFPGKDVDSMLKKEKIHYAYYPESRNMVNAVKNFFLGLKILKKERPDVLFSCGAGIAPPIFLAGKLLGCKLIFMEPYDFIAYPSLSGRLVAPIVDKLLVQHKSQKKFFKKAEFWGATI